MRNARKEGIREDCEDVFLNCEMVLDNMMIEDEIFLPISFLFIRTCSPVRNREKGERKKLFGSLLEAGKFRPRMSQPGA